MQRAALFQPSTFNEADNSVEVVWTTGAPVRRASWNYGEHIETLEVTTRALRLGRLNDGAPFLDSHDQYRLSAVIGSVVPGSVRIAGGQGLARVQFSNDPSVARIVAKVREGHLRNISVGYHVHTYQLFTDDDGPDEYRAVDWEPVEISLVSVPADPGCQLRERNDDMTRVIEGGRRQRSQNHQTPPAVQNRGSDALAAGDEGESQDGGHPDDHLRPARRERQERAPARGRGVTEAQIRDLCGRADDLPRAFERELLDDHADEPLSLRELQTRISDELVRIRERPSVDLRGGGPTGGFTDQQDGPVGTLRARMADALYARMSGTAPTEQGREFVGASLVDMARGLLEARGERVRWASASSVVQRIGQHSTSDFATIMSSAAHRYLIDVVRDYPSPLRQIARQRTANDFRMITVAQLSANPALLAVKENGEIKRGSVAEMKEAYRLHTYARIFGITRQALINDDLGAFTSVFNGWGRAGAELEASLLASLVIGDGPVMDDGKTLYHADHGNKAGAGAAITVASLSAGRQAMRGQKDIDGTSPLNIGPKFLVVGAAKETEAEQVLATLAAAQVSDVNPFAGRLELIVDNRLPGNSWRLFADPAAWPVLEEARLAGQEDVYVESRLGFDVDGIETKARLDIGAAAVDWRGSYLNPGA